MHKENGACTTDEILSQLSWSSRQPLTNGSDIKNVSPQEAATAGSPSLRCEGAPRGPQSERPASSSVWPSLSLSLLRPPRPVLSLGVCLQEISSPSLTVKTEPRRIRIRVLTLALLALTVNSSTWPQLLGARLD